MGRALIWKEWRRLRGLRWACVGLGVAFPAVLFLASHVPSRAFGLGALAGYSSRTLLLEVVPAVLLLGLWPLAAMLLTVNALTADRAEGTESFLLDRPVSRQWVWWARLLASFGSFLTVMGTGIVLVLLFAASEGSIPHLGLRAGVLALAGIALVLAATLASLGATSLVSAPLPALLLALLFAAFPLLAGAGGAMVFPHAVWNRVPVASLAACAIGLGLPLASWLAETRGEPSGRGRRWRAASVLGASFLLAAAGFAVLAPAAVRAGARSGRFSVVGSLGGPSMVALNDSGGGVLVGLEKGEERALLAPEVTGAQWDPSGSRLALFDASGPLGSVGTPRLRFLDPEGRDIWPAMGKAEDLPGVEIAWSGDRLAVLRATDAGGRVLSVVDPASARETRLAEAFSMALHELRDGRVFVAISEATGPQGLRGARFHLHAIDAEHARLGPALLEDTGPGYFAPNLSPSGRYWVAARGAAGPVVLEIGSGRRLPLPIPPHTWPVWSSADTLVWLARDGGGAWTLFRFAPGGEPQAVAHGQTQNVHLLVSPDRTRVLVHTPGAGLTGATLLALDGRALPVPASAVGRGEVVWAGANTLALCRWHRLELHDVLRGGRLVVFGGV